MDRLLQSWVTQQAEIRPDATAIVSGTHVLNYSQLEVLSNQLAHRLKDAGCKNGDRVCILMPKSPEAIVSMIGILKAGGMHVPIDVATPSARIRHILDSCENQLILASGRVTPLLDELLNDDALRSRIAVGWLDEQPIAGKHFTPLFTRADVDSAPASPLPQERKADDGSHISSPLARQECRRALSSRIRTFRPSSRGL